MLVLPRLAVPVMPTVHSMAVAAIVATVITAAVILLENAPRLIYHGSQQVQFGQTRWLVRKQILLRELTSRWAGAIVLMFFFLVLVSHTIDLPLVQLKVAGMQLSAAVNNSPFGLLNPLGAPHRDAKLPYYIATYLVGSWFSSVLLKDDDDVRWTTIGNGWAALAVVLLIFRMVSALLASEGTVGVIRTFIAVACTIAVIGATVARPKWLSIWSGVRAALFAQALFGLMGCVALRQLVGPSASFPPGNLSFGGSVLFRSTELSLALMLTPRARAWLREAWVVVPLGDVILLDGDDGSRGGPQGSGSANDSAVLRGPNFAICASDELAPSESGTLRSEVTEWLPDLVPTGEFEPLQDVADGGDDGGGGDDGHEDAHAFGDAGTGGFGADSLRPRGCGAAY